MRRILFRVDAASTVGLGHLQRCLSLAAALRHFGVMCFFLTNDDSEAHERVSRFGFDHRTLVYNQSWGKADVEKTVSTGAKLNCSAVIVDSDYEGAEYLDQLQRSGYFVVAIEDTVPHQFPCHMVINGDAHARQLHYESPFKDVQYLLGPEYSILRPEFWNLPDRLPSDKVDNVLVTLGGADTYNIMPRVLKILDNMQKRFAVTAIVGPFFKNYAEIQAIAQVSQRNIRLVKSPDSVCNLMMKADLAISAGGQTLYELACVGCPTVAVRVADNQDGQLAAFEKSGFIRISGDGSQNNIVKAIAETLKPLLVHREIRVAMASAGQCLIDGRGALRVANRIQEALLQQKQGNLA
jgi:UDP-2,4-diacetamido-2,4,6-trideoxy-beta-L-altropyranose hydrolase